jgi:hypothetical protein
MDRTVRGQVSWEDTGEPLVGVIVTLFDVASGRPLAEAITNQEGTYVAEWRDDLRENDADRALEIALEVRDDQQRALTSTREFPVRLATPEASVDVAIPVRLRGLEPGRSERPKIQVGPIALDAEAVAKAEPEIVLEIARALVDPEFEEEARFGKRVRDRIGDLSPDLIPSAHVRGTLCGTDILLTIEALIAQKGWPRDVALQVDEILRMRPRDSDGGNSGNGGNGFTEQTHLCPNFSITYQDSGPAAVDPDTSSQQVIDPGGTTPLDTLPAGAPPTYVKRVCFWLERALATYVSPPFGMRNPAAGGRIPVVINTAPFGSASTGGTFFINNALPADVLCAVAVHELFHMVQFRYSGSGTWRSGMLEGGATWAEDTAADLMNRYLDEAGTNFNGSGYMIQPHTSLEDVGFRYKTSLFFRYVAEQHSPRIGSADEPLIGVETYRQLIEQCEAGSWSSDDIRQALRVLPWYQDFYEFGYLDAARADLTSAETTLGNFALACYLKDLGTNTPDRRYEFVEDEENIFIDDVVATVIPGTPLQATLASVTLAGTGTVSAATSVSFSNSVARFSSRYYQVSVDPAVTSVQVQFTAGGGLSSPIFQVVLIDEDNAVREIYRTDRSSYIKRFPNLRDGKRLNRAILVVTGAASAGSFSVSASPAAAAPDVMVTRWHSALKTEYEIDSRNWAWTWVSPDIWVDNDMDGLADGDVFFNFDNKLNIRLHNKGNLDASNIAVEFHYQDASGGLSPTAWLPVSNVAGVVQTLSGLALAAGTSQNWSVDWSPVPSGLSSHFCVRAVVTVPGDPNTDNKRVLSNFGNVHVRFRSSADLSILRRNLRLERLSEIELILVNRLTAEFQPAPRDLATQAVRVLKPGEVQVDLLRLYHRPQAGKMTQDKPRKDRERGEEAECACAAPLPRLELRPDPLGHYATDERALPPGIAGKPLVTLAHLVDGIPQGGVTFMVTLDR